ncbi:MAG: transcription termination/antitermination protein NusA [Chloroflexi bacterium]|nr:transcription termination/antitermination protein NusA [Chloroflexota bacterium]
MKSEFLLAITQLSAEKSLPKEVVINAIEAALVSAYRKDNFIPNQNIVVKINPTTGKVEVWAEKEVVEKPADSRREISLQEARRAKADVQVGDTLMVESTPQNAGRIAAQTAKQVILQRLHEAEHSAIFEEYTNKEGDAITGLIQRIEPGQITVDLGRTEAVLPAAEQMRSERYRVGQRLKVLVLQAARTSKGARVIVSRSHPDLLRRLFELEVPEVYNGTVEIKSVAREAGYRSKVAVSARQEGIDPVGCCVGLRGIRIQNTVNELNGEKIDVVTWHSDPAVFIASALSPAHIVSVELNQAEKIARVVVPDKQLSLAIGKEGQNARLAAKLTGWRIDIKSGSAVEAEKAAAARAEAEKAEKARLQAAAEAPPPPVAVPPEPVMAAPQKPAPAIEPEPAAPEPVVAEPVAAEPVTAKAEVEVTEPAPVTEEKAEAPPPEPVAVPVQEAIPARFLAPREGPNKSQIRFAEDLLMARTGKADKSKKKKKKGYKEDEAPKAKRARREFDYSGDDEV